MIITIFALIILLFSVMIHEISHGAMAYYLGDPTAKYAGRLTLNPLKHLDVFGSIILPLALAMVGTHLIGWAKPVPINPNNLRDKWGELKVSLAGPLSNFTLALVFGLIIRIVPLSLISNLEPLFSYIVVINIMLAVFNLIPIPPLDGSHILFRLLPFSPPIERFKFSFQQYGFLILIILIFLIPQFSNYLFYAASILFNLITGLTLAM